MSKPQTQETTKDCSGDPAAPDGEEFARASALADRALELAETYRTPPVPHTFEVWFTYASGSDPQVCGSIDAMIGEGKAVAAYDIDQIYTQHLSADARKGEQLTLANKKLDKEMDDILELIQSHLLSSKHYSGTLVERARTLSDDASPATIRRTIELLLDENKTMRAETGKLTNSLENSRAQIHELRANLAKSRENEMRDPLTNIANRRRFEICLAEEVERSRSAKTPLCLVYADLDDFKRVNDAFGHLIGDEVLKYFSSLLVKNVRKQDLPARYGGEEFAVIMPGATVDDASQLIEPIRQKMQQTKLVVTENNQSLGTITASFGIAEFTESDDVVQLMKRADANLYMAKDAGRNCIVSRNQVHENGGAKPSAIQDAILPALGQAS